MKTKILTKNFRIFILMMAVMVSCTTAQTQLVDQTNSGLNPADNPGYEAYTKAMSYRESGEFELAVEEFNKSISLNPDNVETYLQLGRTYLDLEQTTAALNTFDKALEIDPNFAQAINGKGVVYSVIEEVDKALAEFSHAIEVQPKYADPYINRSFLNLQLGYFDLALEDTNTAINLEPEFWRGYYNRALIFYSMGDKDQLAIEDFNKVLNLTSDESVHNMVSKYLEVLLEE